MSDGKDLREKILRRWVVLCNEREPYESQWLEISRHITPASGRFLGTDVKNQSRSRWNKIYDNAATYAATILSSGLQSGMNDPSTQWFALTTGTPDLDESHEVKVYLDRVQRILEMAFESTNVYQALHHGWREVGVYGTCAMIIVEDAKAGFHCYPLVCGEYCVGVDACNRPNTVYRRFSMTAAQMIEQYGRAKCSKAVRDAYDQGRPDKSFKCIHAIEPRFDRDRTKKDNLNMPWRMVVLQIDCDEGEDGILQESGYNEFPAVVGRWGANASDVYSEEAPGIIAIGDTKQLHHECLQKGNAIDYAVNPPLIFPVSAKESELDFLPGGRNFIDMPSQANQVQSAWAVRPDLTALAADMQDIRQRINQAFCVDMFLMVSSANKHQMTAEEVARRNEEKLMLLGPVLSRLNNEVLKSLIERAFNILARAGQLPPAPPELQGQQLKIRYMSMLSRAQRSLRANSLDQYLMRIGNLAQYDNRVIKKIDPFAAADEYADYLSVAPSVVVPTEQAMQAVEAENQAMQQQAQQAQMAQGVDSLAKLGKVPADGSTMAGKVVQGMMAAQQ